MVAFDKRLHSLIRWARCRWRLEYVYGDMAHGHLRSRSRAADAEAASDVYRNIHSDPTTGSLRVASIAYLYG